MKTHLIIMALMVSLFQNSTAQQNTINDLDNILNEVETDTIAKIERLAAFEFHHLINNYRKKHRKQALAFDEIMWIAARNHNLYMKTANNLTHRENMSLAYLNSFSTGNYPSERIKHAAAEKISYLSANGENCLYNYNFYGNTYVEIAKNMALSAFNQWKNSSGHNENILTSSYSKHGVAFTYDNGKIWATNLFTSHINYVENDNTVAQTTVPKTTTKNKRIQLYKVKNELQKQLETHINLNNTLKTNRKMTEEAKKQARILAYSKKKYNNNNGVLVNEQENIETKGWLKWLKKEVSIYSLMIEEDANDFDVATTTAKLIVLLTNNQTTNQKKKCGTGIMVKKQKNRIRITLVSMAV